MKTQRLRLTLEDAWILNALIKKEIGTMLGPATGGILITNMPYYEQLTRLSKILDDFVLTGFD